MVKQSLGVNRCVVVKPRSDNRYYLYLSGRDPSVSAVVEDLHRLFTVLRRVISEVTVLA